MKYLRILGSAAAMVALAVAIAFVGSLGRSSTSIQPGATGSPAIQPGAVGLPEPPPNVVETPPASLGVGLACGQFTAHALRINYSAAEWAVLADAVVTGTVVSIDEGHWATPDGASPRSEGERPTAFDVYRVAEVKIGDVGKATALADIGAGDTIKIRVIGGTVDCRTFNLEGEPEIKVGMDVALFLTEDPQPNLAAAPFEGFDAIGVWPIEQGQARGPSGHIAIDDLLAVASGQ